MRVVLIQHLLELTERSNTGRHAVGVVPSLDVRVFGARDAALKVDDLAGAWLLWPGEPPPHWSAVPHSESRSARHGLARRATAAAMRWAK